MLRRCCMTVILLTLLCVGAAAGGLELRMERIQCFEENVIELTAPASGDVIIRVTDSRGRLCRTLAEPVEAGENRLRWNGLGENDEPLESGEYTLTASLYGAESCFTVRTQKSAQALLLALPSSPTLYLGGGEKWFMDVKMVRAGRMVMEVAAQAAPEKVLVRERKQITSNGNFTYVWDGGGLPAGEYVVRCWAEENPAYVSSFTLTLDDSAQPILPVTLTGDVMPASLDDKDVWAAMMQPSVVCELTRSTDHQKVFSRPTLVGDVVGTLHGRSQAVEVLEFYGEEWARIAAWNHESGSRIVGYVPRSVLRTVTPNPEYGILVNKQEQTLTVYYRGERLGTAPVSTGLMAPGKLIRETTAGAFLTMERIKAFDSDGYHYLYPIRYDGGNLIHAIGSKTVNGTYDYADEAADLGRKASHGCVRVAIQPSEEGINAYWLWTHIPYHTRVLILDDPDERLAEAMTIGETLTEAEPPIDPEELPVRTGSMPETDDVLTLTFGGDAVLGVRENWWKREDALPAYLEKYGMAYPFSGLQSIFAADDMTLVNLECVLKGDRSGEKPGKQYHFRGLPSWTQVLSDGSVEQVNIANNHYIDYEAAGKKATRMALDAAGIPFSGYTFTHVWEKNGHKIGFAGCRETMYAKNKGVIAEEVQALRAAGCAVVIYSCHWGNEYEERHNDMQLEMARAAAAAGVDIIVGTHPHVVQGLDEVDGTAVIWSLGNLMFAGTLDMLTYDAALAKATLAFVDGRYAGVTIELVPILTSSRASEGVNDFRPMLAEGEDAARILRKIQTDTGFRLNGPVWFPAKGK